ncbi:hypothetical protein [Arthrobacter sp. CAU 1506]|uniref:hypothetical protein n=1 Tax=Arthrobacter sp. CAU 1506 TaxID=2560052 RepID=UPI001F0E00D6|nr:hypothetical protein [Arthrobacter sp. CAU 1506]
MVDGHPEFLGECTQGELPRLRKFTATQQHRSVRANEGLQTAADFWLRFQDGYLCPRSCQVSRNHQSRQTCADHGTEIDSGILPELFMGTVLVFLLTKRTSWFGNRTGWDASAVR